MSPPPATNVLGGPLVACSFNPVTGWFRDGCCRTDDNDLGSHIVCTQVTDAFLAFSMAEGNDLSTPAPQWGFPGLNAGDRWCLCATRWRDALEAGVAPPVVLESCHVKLLELVSLETLLAHAVGAEA